MKKTIPIIVMAMLCLIGKSKAQEPLPKTPVKTIVVTGRVVDNNGIGLPNASIKSKATGEVQNTHEDGSFSIGKIPEYTRILVSYIGYLTFEFQAKVNQKPMLIKLIPDAKQLNEVVVSTGYQNIPKERATGSFTLIDNKLLNRAVSPDLLSRLKGITNGLLFDSKTGNPSGISVRGRSTLFSDTKPLIVIDNFPFEGDLNTINPNDVENVTVLKDAAAASIWGVRAGNGVIVITTKRGKPNQKTAVNFNANVTVGDKPDLKYQPQLTSNEFIEVEQFLFDKGKYTSALRNNYSLISPVVAILQKQKLDPTFADEAKKQIDALRNIDVRDQLNKYFYQKSVRQQYHLDLNGGGPNQSYYFSGGYDQGVPNEVGSSDSRLTLKGNNTYSLLKNRLKLSTDITLSKSKSDRNNGYAPVYPYEQIADAYGNPLATLVLGGLRSQYTDTAGRGNLLDWKYRPLDELQRRSVTSKTDLTDYRILLGLNYKIIEPLNISANYQYYSSNQKGENSYDRESFYARNLVNTASRINALTGYVNRSIPIGDIYTPSFADTESNYGRLQLNYNQFFNKKHEVNAIAGYEVRDESYQYTSTTFYGYFPETATSTLVDLATQYPSYYGPGASSITLGKNNTKSGLVNRYLSYYGNASYVYNGKYVLSGSYRKDESNLFGVKANQKGVPLWSAGLSWNAHKESFFKADWISLLQFKATYGYNGNVNKTVSAFLTAQALGTNPIYTNTNYATIINPPNDALRWERVKNINLGLDFIGFNNRISTSLEYYVKNGVDLIGVGPIAPQTGVSTFTGNSANTHTSGIDFQVTSKNITGLFNWTSTFIFNHVKDRVTTYKGQRGINADLVNATFGLTPLLNYPINTIFGFKWNSLDATGSPQGDLNGVLSNDYTSILNSTNTSGLDFFGSAVPINFGTIRNTFSYKNIEISFNISAKFNYYFRRSSLNYSNLFSGNYQQADYNLRWQKPGDELITDVPSVKYPIDNNRNDFYRLSSVLVEKGDHIRLQDIQLNYAFFKTDLKRLPFSMLNVYIYTNNLGILWRANKHHLDPDIRSGYLTPKSIAFGLNANF